MKYQTFLAAALLSLSSVASYAADNDQQSNASQGSTTDTQSSHSAGADTTTGGLKSNEFEKGVGEHVTGQASSAEQIEADTSQQAQQASQNQEPSPEADRKTGQASSADSTAASSQQDSTDQGQSAQANNGDTQDSGTANQQDQTAAGTQDSDANYSAELKDCDSLQGTEKQSCLDSAPKKPGEM